jgi:ABC-type antimicrobial peptide transport system permease subunit
LYSIDGVEYIVKDRGVLATTIKSHILINPSDLSFSAKTKGVKNTDGTYGFCNVNYKLFDEEVLDNIQYKGGTVTGDIESVLNTPYVIAISDSINNSRQIKLEVGDTIRVSVSYVRRRLWPSNPMTSYREFLEACFRSYYFQYVELTVGAIVSDLPVGSEFPLYMNAKTFQEVTGQEPYFAKISIYCKEDINSTELQEVQRKLYDYQQFYKMKVENTDRNTERAVQYIKNYPGIILYISLLLLFVSVLITTLNQTLFYQMRKQELDIYLCLGSDFRQLRKLFWVDAGFFATLSGIVYTVFSFIITAIVFKVANLNIAATTIRYQYAMPLDAFAFGLAVVIGASIFSVMFSYYLFKKRSAPVFTGAAVAGVEEGDASGGKSVIFDSDIR